MLSAGIVTISIDLGVSITDIALLSGYQLLVVGASGYIPEILVDKVFSSLGSLANLERDPSIYFPP